MSLYLLEVLSIIYIVNCISHDAADCVLLYLADNTQPEIYVMVLEAAHVIARVAHVLQMTPVFMSIAVVVTSTASAIK